MGIFPNEAAAVRLVGAILADAHDEYQATDRRYLSERSMTQLHQPPDTITTAELTNGYQHRPDRGDGEAAIYMAVAARDSYIAGDGPPHR